MSLKVSFVCRFCGQFCACTHTHTEKVGVCGIKIGMHWDLVNNEQRQTLEEALHQSAKLYKQSLCALTAFIL